MAKKNMCVVRNAAYSKGSIGVRERHNERENVDYFNGDIINEYSKFNAHYKKCPGTYEQEFNRMVDSGEISLRGLRADAKVFNEFQYRFLYRTP